MSDRYPGRREQSSHRTNQEQARPYDFSRTDASQQERDSRELELAISNPNPSQQERDARELELAMSNPISRLEAGHNSITNARRANPIIFDHYKRLWRNIPRDQRGEGSNFSEISHNMTKIVEHLDEIVHIQESFIRDQQLWSNDFHRGEIQISLVDISRLGNASSSSAVKEHARAFLEALGIDRERRSFLEALGIDRERRL